MNATWTPTSSNKRKQRNRRLLAFFIVLLVGLGGYACTYFQGPVATDTEPLPVAEETITEEPEVVAVVEEAPVPDNIFTHIIESGDNLSAIFDTMAIGQPILHQILAADESLLALDLLHPGNRLTFTLNQETGVLDQMELYTHPGRQIYYRRVNDDSFEYEEVVTPGLWEQQLICGEINGTFYLSAQHAGLSEQETANIADLFRSKLNFARDIRKGDHFQVIRKQQFVNGEYTGQSYIEGIRMFNRNQTYTAFLFDDGNYYDQNGESLASAFLRYPFKGNYRISSPFNLKRLHPITRRVSPHSGTDFAMPTGTTIMSTGDGVVSRVKNHPYAGKYIEITHNNGQYVTRYLHLNRILVKRGQKVKRGDRIAMSGNTGRSTGPHLHFELRIKGRPVDATRAKIPMAAAVPKDKRQEFQQRVASIIALMEVPQQQIATSSTTAPQPTL